MFKIAICDDEDTLIGELKEDLERYAAEFGREFCIFTYHDGSELLQGYTADYDLIFMDIKGKWAKSSRRTPQNGKHGGA